MHIVLLALMGCKEDVVVDADGDGFSEADCDDTNAAVNPAAEELCNGIDDDCDGLEDDNPTDGTAYFEDLDEDGFGNPLSTVRACSVPSRFTPDSGDCDDLDEDVNPEAAEVCDGVDNDCDGVFDDFDSDVVAGLTGFDDVDGDGFGDATSPGVYCALPEGVVSNDLDCDDASVDRFPGAPELCNGVDDDCDGLLDSDDPESLPDVFWFVDLDGDGAAGTAQSGCELPVDAEVLSSDCNDTNPSIYPNAPELCDGLDNDCDTLVDDADDAVSGMQGFADTDGDGFGDPAAEGSYCTLPAGIVANADDCDDASSTINPSATEMCNTVDDDCDGLTDDAGGVVPPDATPVFEDLDGDGVGAASLDGMCVPQATDVLVGGDCDDSDAHTYPGAVELCDGVDNDCVGDGDAEGATFFADGAEPLDVSADFASGTLAAPFAWDATASGRLSVCGGAWFVNLGTGGFDLSVEGTDLPTRPVLDGAGAAPVITAIGGSLALSNLAITGGLGNGTHTSTFPYGGGVHCENGSVTGAGLDMYENAASLGAGLGSYLCDVTLTDSVIRDNEGLAFAGGVFHDGGLLTLEDALIEANTAAFFGGGVYLFGTNQRTQAEFVDTSFLDNTAGSGGAAVLVYSDADATCRATSPGASVFARNASPTGAVHLALADSSLQSAECDFQGVGADDNPPADVYLEDLDESVMVEDAAILTCTGTLGCLIAP